MYKKFMASLSAVTMAAALMSTQVVTAFATEDTTQLAETQQAAEETAAERTDIVKNDGTSAVSVTDGSSKTVNGDVITSGYTKTYEDYAKDVHYQGDPAVNVSNGSEVTINGNITAGIGGYEQDAINVNNGKVIVDAANPVTVEGTDHGVNAVNSEVYVDGSVTGGSFGLAVHESNVTVTKNVNATGQQVTVTERQKDGTYKPIDVTTAGTGIFSTSGNIEVQGNVYAVDRAVEIFVSDSEEIKKTNLVVEGTVVSGEGTGIYIYDPEDSKLTDKDQILARIPDITVYEIQPEGYSMPIYSYFSNATEEVNNEVRQTVLESVNYIIKSDKDLGVSFLDGVQAGEKYNTVNYNKKFTVQAALNDNQMLTAGSNVIVKEIGGGKYELTLLSLRGGINIKAILRPVPVVTNEEPAAKEEEKTPEVVYEIQVQEATPAYADPAQAPAGAITVSAPAAAPTAEVAAISGDKPASMVSLNLGKVTPIQYRELVVQNVATAPANGAFNIETDRVSYFDRNMINALAARSDIDVNVVFMYAGKRMKVTIPAGYDVKTLLDANGYCGFLRLMAILGGTEL